MPLYADADIRMDVPSAASPIGFLRWHAFCCSDKLRLILTLVSQSRHVQIPALGCAIAIGPIGGLTFLCPALASFLRHDLCDRTASRSGLDSREHGASLDQVGKELLQ
jgi:hypothetical protein